MRLEGLTSGPTLARVLRPARSRLQDRQAVANGKLIGMSVFLCPVFQQKTAMDIGMLQRAQSVCLSTHSVLGHVLMSFLSKAIFRLLEAHSIFYGGNCGFYYI